MTERQRQIIQFYEEFPRQGVFSGLDGMLVFLPVLFRERQLDHCAFFTSHHILCISLFEDHAERDGKPLMHIISGKNLLGMGVRIELTRRPVRRWIEESVSCPMDKGLEEFDRLYEKFIDAHARPPLPSE